MADAPVDALLLRSEDLAKGWLLALLEQAPLERMPSVLASDLAQDGPRICGAVVRALSGEDDLRRLEVGGALEQLVSRVGEIAGASGPEATAAAVDALADVIWSAVRAELRDPDPEQVSALAERLALAIGLVRGASLRSATAIGEPLVMRREAPAPPRETPPVSPPRTAPEAADHPAPAHEALWIGAIEEEIAQAERSYGPLSLLLVEFEEADRLSAIESPREASATFGRFAQALRSALRRQDILACETEARAWIIARDTDRQGARALAERVAAAVREAPPWRGGPLTVNVGVAVLGEDGGDTAALIDAAEEAKFAAAASGIAVAPLGDEPDVPPVEPDLPPEGGQFGGDGPRLVG